jgi:hypothetical protein
MSLDLDLSAEGRPPHGDAARCEARDRSRADPASASGTFDHNQRGVAPQAIELHPIVGIRVRSCRSALGRSRRLRRASCDLVRRRGRRDSL